MAQATERSAAPPVSLGSPSATTSAVSTSSVTGVTHMSTEEEFVTRVDHLSATLQRDELRDLLREEHAVYLQRSGDAISRMRGWALLGLARTGVVDADLSFVFEELESGIDPYLVAAASRALRSYAQPKAEFVPFAIRAFTNLRTRDEPVSFESYGDFGTSSTTLAELAATLEWLAPVSREWLSELDNLTRDSTPRRYRQALQRIVGAARSAKPVPPVKCCGFSNGWRSLVQWARGGHLKGRVEDIQFEDQAGDRVQFDELFRGRPSVVVFFYTRCDNPLKCSLTISKLARIQAILRDKGLADAVGVHAITYDPRFDNPQRMYRYGVDRGFRFDERYRMLRAVEGFDVLREYFALGVNFVASLVNRHRLEAYVLDRNGAVASQWVRLQWDESKVVERAIELLQVDSPTGELSTGSARKCSKATGNWIVGTLGAVASVAVAFFPKCPVCWAATLSVCGLSGMASMTSSPWMLTALLATMLGNLTFIGVRGWRGGGFNPFLTVLLGNSTIVTTHLMAQDTAIMAIGIALTFAGTVWASFVARKDHLALPSK